MTKWYNNILLLFLILLILLMIDLFLGSIDIFDSDFDFRQIILDIRLPKTLTAIAAGGMLALSGLLLQILFRNPLAGPYVLGISSASSLFSAIATMSAGASYSIYIYQAGVLSLSIIGALFGLLIIFILIRMSSQITIILLVGLMLSQLYNAVLNILSYLSNEQSLKVYTLWTMGTIQNTDLSQSVLLLFIGISTLIISLFFTKSLMLYLIGDDDATIMGMHTQKIKNKIILLTATITGILTAYCGPIAFIGMSVPVLVRILQANANIRLWIIHSFLLGSIFLMVTDILNQYAFDGSVPLNILLSLWGVPLLIWIFLKQSKKIIFQ